jgi:aspartyl-tRNA(Asn)/glutamyl-tRNA(Gln) amidotransferase subunit A
MARDGFEFATITDVGERLRDGSVTSVALTELMLERIQALDPKLNAFITVTGKLALEQAQRADEALSRGLDRGALHGVPIALKDLIATRGVRTTAGTKHYDRVPEEDAPVVRRLADAGAVLLGKTGLHELAFGSTSNNPHFGAIHNPWQLSHHPGGSSGGSAVAIAAGLAYAVLGTDTGCSIRQPAQCCGIVGHKPTFGLVSKRDIVPLVWSLDHVGPLTRSVRDAALVLQVIAGFDPADPYSVDRTPEDYVTGIDQSIAGAVVGVPRPFFFEGGDPEVVALVERALYTFERLGARLVEVEIENAQAAFQATGTTFAEVGAVHLEAAHTNPGGFSEEVVGSIEGVSGTSLVDYVTAQRFRRIFHRQVESLFDRCDILAMPTSTIAATPIDDDSSENGTERWKNTAIFNLTGHPSISIPCGFTDAGLPVGLMLTGAMFADAKVLRVAHAFQRATEWHKRHPPLAQL